jgi:hypothetical protein
VNGIFCDIVRAIAVVPSAQSVEISMRPPLASALMAIRPNGSTLNVEEVLYAMGIYLTRERRSAWRATTYSPRQPTA